MPEQSPFPLPPQAFAGQSRVADAGACFDWLRQGWATFMVNPGVWLGMTAILLVLLLALLAVPVLGSVAVALFSPALAAGLFEACRRCHTGQDPSLGDLFRGFGPRAGGLVILGALSLAGSLLIGVLVGFMGGGSLAGGLLFGSTVPVAGLGVLLGGLLVTLLLGLVLATPLLMALTFSPALVMFHAMAPVPALQASFNACLKNWLPFSVFGVILCVLAFFAALPLGLGYLLLIPVLCGALYAAYRDIFVGI